METLDTHDLVLVMFALCLLQEELDALTERLENILLLHVREQRRLVRSLPVDKKRVMWSRFCDTISDTHFRRMFRMEPSVFAKLSQLICQRVGEDKFRPEAYLLQKLDNEDELKGICGEIKLAVCIRLLAGGSYLDLVPLFGIGSSYVYVLFENFLHWIMSTFEFPLVQLLRQRDWKSLKLLANGFAEKTNGVFYGPFGALDGLAVRVKCPTLKEVADPGNYYCRKGFYAVNVQAICDKWKRFLWAYPSNKGSTHDSTAFGGSRLVDLLKELEDELYEQCLFIVGDSAYALAPYLLIPYDITDLKEDPDHLRDAFNFYLSSCRIHIECAFGELVMRWGIFWRTLRFDLNKCSRIVQSAMLLQNFIIENRVDGVWEDAHFANFSINVDALQVALTEETGEAPNPLVSDNNEQRPPGRRTKDDVELATKGGAVRERLTNILAINEMKRPIHNNMKYNQYGNIYMTS